MSHRNARSLLLATFSLFACLLPLACAVAIEPELPADDGAAGIHTVGGTSAGTSSVIVSAGTSNAFGGSATTGGNSASGSSSGGNSSSGASTTGGKGGVASTGGKSSGGQ